MAYGSRPRLRIVAGSVVLIALWAYVSLILSEACMHQLGAARESMEACAHFLLFLGIAAVCVRAMWGLMMVMVFRTRGIEQLKETVVTLALIASLLLLLGIVNLDIVWALALFAVCLVSVGLHAGVYMLCAHNRELFH